MGKNELSKILFLSGLGLLALLIVLRMITLKRKEQKIEMKKIEDVKPEDCKIPAKEKRTDLLDHLKSEEEKAKIELSAMQYVQLDLRKLVEKDTNPGPEEKVVKTEQHIEQRKETPVREILLKTTLTNSKTSSKRLPKERSLFQDSSVSSSSSSSSVVAPTKTVFGTMKVYSAESDLQDTGKSYYRAEVYGDQKLMSNTALVVRNLEELNYKGIRIPRNSLFYGIAAFSGNRVLVHISKVKTALGEYPVKYNIMDNDRIEGLFYQAPVDEVVASTTDNSNLNSNLSTNPVYGNAINNMSRGAVNSAKQLLQKSRSLTLPEGYALYILQVKKQ